jgi:hypothetical protein
MSTNTTKTRTKSHRLAVAVLIIILLASPLQMAHAAPGLALAYWIKSYGSAIGLSTLTSTSDNAVIATGRSFSTGVTVALKVNSAGDIVWQRGYPGALGGTSDDVAPTPDGGVILAGYANGDLVWLKQYEGGDASTSIYISRTGGGNYVVVTEAGLILKIKDNGDVIWRTQFSGQYSAGIAGNADGGALVVGWVSPAGNLWKGWATRFDAQGNVLWQKQYDRTDSQNDLLTAVTQTQDDGYLLGGRGRSTSWIIKINAQGQIIWERDYSIPLGATQGITKKLLALPDGSYISLDNGVQIAGIPPQISISFRPIVMHIDANGGIIWQRAYTDKFNASESKKAALLSDGSFAFLSDVRVVEQGETVVQYRIAKLNGDGLVGSSSCDQISTTDRVGSTVTTTLVSDSNFTNTLSLNTSIISPTVTVTNTEFVSKAICSYSLNLAQSVYLPITTK